jgi:arginine:ornithine antiporter/lysine permease
MKPCRQRAAGATVRPETRVLGFLPLLAVVVGAIVGVAIFNAPADLGRVANPGWIVAAWAITGTGMFSLAKIFQYLATRRPELEGGIYSYAREAAGEFTGFNSAYGYWWSALFANLAFFFAIAKVLGLYLPFLARDKWAAFALSSVLLWGYAALIAAGIRTAGAANLAITLLKLVPLVFVALLAAFLFKPAMVGDPFSGILKGTGAAASAWQQLGGSFGVMVFAFMGIEGGVTISAKARNTRDVGRVGLTGFLVTLVLYVAVSTLTMGVAPARDIINAPSPLGAVLGSVMGGFGRHFLNFGFLFSVLGALLAWLLLTAEVPYSAAIRDNAFPRAFARSNARATPIFSLAVTAAVSQVLLALLFLFARSADITARGNAPLLQSLYFGAISISVICGLVPYALSALLGARQAHRDGRRAPLVYAALSITLFAWMFVFMAKYTAAALVVYASGLAFRLRVHRERGERMPVDEAVFYIVMLAAGAAVLYFIIAGRIRF